jgi:hypothetical protein
MLNAGTCRTWTRGLMLSVALAGNRRKVQPAPGANRLPFLQHTLGAALWDSLLSATCRAFIQR